MRKWRKKTHIEVCFYENYISSVYLSYINNIFEPTFTLNTIRAAELASFNVKSMVQEQTEVQQCDLSEGHSAKIWQQRNFNGAIWVACRSGPKIQTLARLPHGINQSATQLWAGDVFRNSGKICILDRLNNRVTGFLEAVLSIVE